MRLLVGLVQSSTGISPEVSAVKPKNISSQLMVPEIEFQTMFEKVLVSLIGAGWNSQEIRNAYPIRDILGGFRANCGSQLHSR
jgi:hypothetical protein